MDNSLLSPVVKPEVWQIFELVRDAAAGKLRIPDFQRPFVWRREQMLELLDSIRKRYPIGSLLVWETEEEVSSKDSIGPVRIVDKRKGLASLILDGHQRISTLTGTLLEPQEDSRLQDDPDPDRWNIWFNAKDETFEHLNKHKQNRPEPWHFPMRKIMETIDFLTECERMLKNGGENGKLFVSRTQDLLRIFVDQQIPVVRIKNADLSQAVNIFARLNSTGKKISADEMAEAITYKEGRKSLASYIDQLADMLFGHGFGKMDRSIILRAILACMNEDIYSSAVNWARFDDSKREKLDLEFASIMEAMEQAAEFLNQLGARHDRLLPYANQLVVMTAFFHGCPNPTQAQDAFLERWFWASSFTGWFASGNPARFAALVKEMHERVAHDPAPSFLENMHMDEPAQPFPKYFDMRSARARTWLLVMLSKKPLDDQGAAIQDPWLLAGEHSLNYIAATKDKVKDKSLYSSPANRILRLNPKDRAQAMNWLNGLQPNVGDTVLESHGIKPDSLQLLRDGKREEFLKERQENLIQMELSFMQVKGVARPQSVSPQASPLDAND